MRYANILLLCLFSFRVYAVADGNKEVDSLKKILAVADSAALKLKTLNLLVKKTLNNPTEAKSYAAWALKIAAGLNDSVALALTYNQIGIIYYYQGELEQSKKNLEHSNSIYSAIKDKKGIANSLNGIGVIYYDQGNLSEALSYFLKSIEIKENLEDKYGYAMTLNNIGNVYKDLKDFNKAMDYYEKSVAIKEKIDDKHGLAMSYNNMGLLLSDFEQHSKALEYYGKSVLIKEGIDDNHGMAMTLNNIGLVYERMKDYSSALKFYNKSIKIKNEIGDKYGLAMSYINIGNVYKESGQLKKTLDFLHKALELANSINAKTLKRDAHQRIYETYDLLGDTDKAYKYYKNYSILKDSMLNEAGIKSITEMQAKYESEKKQLQIQSLNQQKVLHDTILARKTEEAKRKEIEVFSLSAGLFLFILFSVYVWYNYRKSRKGEELLESSLKEKEVLLKEVHHRVKNNFQVISSLLNLQANTITDEKTQKALLDAQNRIRSMSLVHQKLYQTNNFSEIQIGDYIKQLASSIENSYKKKDTDIELEIDTGNLSFSLEIVIPLGLIVNELLTNSYKYAFDEKAKGKIRVKLFKTDENKYNLVVKDNGKGLPPGFELEKQESLGLTLVSLLAEQIGGEVKAENHAGCSFTISFKENLA